MLNYQKPAVGIPSIIPLIMTNSLPWKDPPIFKKGKPSISMGQWEIQDPKMEVRKRTIFQALEI